MDHICPIPPCTHKTIRRCADCRMSYCACPTCTVVWSDEDQTPGHEVREANEVCCEVAE